MSEFQFETVERKTRPFIHHLSASAIDTYRFCGEQYRLKYIENIEIPPSFYMILGKIVHLTLENWVKGIINPAPCNNPDVLFMGACMDTLDPEAFNIYLEYQKGDLSLAKAEEARNSLPYNFPFRCTFIKNLEDAKTAVSKVIENFPYNDLSFSSTEIKIQNDILGIPFTGIIDFSLAEPDGKVVVIDYKTGSPYNQIKTNNSLQFSIYQYLVFKDFGGCFDFFVLNTKDNSMYKKDPLTDADIGNVENIVKNVYLGILNEIFIPVVGMTQGDDKCYNCDYKSYCTYYNKGV